MLAVFLEETVVASPSGFVELDRLHAKYGVWCVANGYQVPQIHELAAVLSERGYTLTWTPRGVFRLMSMDFRTPEQIEVSVESQDG